MLLSIKRPSPDKPAKGKYILAGDIGATKINLALYEKDKDSLILLREENYQSENHNDIIEVTGLFLKSLPAPDVVCLGAAGPVLNGRVTFSNINWIIDSRELSGHFKKDAYVINDLEATAYGLAVLREKDFAVIHEPMNRIEG